MTSMDTPNIDSHPLEDYWRKRKRRIEFVADRDPTPEQAESFKSFIREHPEALGGGAFNVDGVTWISKAIEYEEPRAALGAAQEKGETGS